MTTVRSRTLLGGAGLVAVAVGALVVVAPSSAELLPVDGIVEALGEPWLFVAAFGVAGLVVLVAVMLARAVGGLDESTPPDPEDVYRVPSAGHRFDQFVDGDADLRDHLFGDHHEQVRRRIRDTVLATLMRTGGLSREEARAAVENGTWTDDSVAAAFLSERQRPTFRERLAAAVKGDSSVQQGARRAAEAVDRYGREGSQ